MLEVGLAIALAFIVLWFSSGLTVLGIEHLSKKLRVAPFLVSFFALGFLTSISEISVGIASIIDKTPSISVGNLIGASAFLTLCVVPIQVIISNGIPVNSNHDKINLPIAYLVISLPVLLVLDKSLGYIDAIIMFFSYLFLLFTISGKKNLLENIEEGLNHSQINVYKETLKIVTGAALIGIASKVIVDRLVFISTELYIDPFVIGILFLAVGTNIPELTILARTLIGHKKDIALGDYIGSAALNTLLLSLLIFVNGKPITLGHGLKPNVLLLPLGAVLFLIFAVNKKFERREAAFLIVLYLLFIFLELVI